MNVFQGALCRFRAKLIHLRYRLWFGASAWRRRAPAAVYQRQTTMF